LAICRKTGVDVVFAPAAKQMYPAPQRGGMYPRENLTWVNVEKLTEQLCGRFRQGHFRGVATVCAKLFNIVAPDIAFFGQKDTQQAIVIKRMVADLNMPLKIVVCPTVRQADGLAISSRNQYLTRQQKKYAAYIYKALKKSENLVRRGVKKSKTIISEMKKILKQAPSIKIEYISIVDAETLQELDKITGKVLIAVAVKIGSTRLIDNILVDVNR
jgi:pantoate--beta-alanine ligase